mmetsp:Transcript_34855/g.75257  ORF Transcript_34855/g.75257 Transcript_34855/m.75257 type:complete len:356 (+) Transcript_34855:136-1203(+)
MIDNPCYHPLLDSASWYQSNHLHYDDGSLPLSPPAVKFIRKAPLPSKTPSRVKKAFTSRVNAAVGHTIVNNGHYCASTESRDDENKHLLARDDDDDDDEQLEDRCCEFIESRDVERRQSNINITAIEKRLLLPESSVDLGGLSSRQAPKTLHEIGFQHFKYGKTVHFSTIEVKTYHWDCSCDKDVYYTKNDIANMSKQRFADASTLRKQMRSSGHTKRHEEAVSASLLSLAYEPTEDIHEGLSIRGIEHFVYPELQKEMIRKQKEAQAEVLMFVHSTPLFDPDGLKLREHSEKYSSWARDVAMEKGRNYANNGNAPFVPNYSDISKGSFGLRWKIGGRLRLGLGLRGSSSRYGGG